MVGWMVLRGIGHGRVETSAKNGSSFFVYYYADDMLLMIKKDI